MKYRIGEIKLKYCIHFAIASGGVQAPDKKA